MRSRVSTTSWGLKRGMGVFALIALASTAVLIPSPAGAQNFFEMLFGIRPAPAPEQRYDDRGSQQHREHAAPPVSRKFARMVCIRSCDGARLAMAIQPADRASRELESMCHAAGGGLETRLVAEELTASGFRTASLGSPGAQGTGAQASGASSGNDRQSATCEPSGQFRVPIADDLTLRRGDLVTTETGTMTFVGSGRPPYTDRDFVTTRATAAAPPRRATRPSTTPPPQD